MRAGASPIAGVEHRLAAMSSMPLPRDSHAFFTESSALRLEGDRAASLR
jgi:hypothetical protein